MKIKHTIIAALMLAAPGLAQAATYSLSSTNFTGLVADYAVTDNTGSTLVGDGVGIATMGYFRTITNPGTASIGSLAADFEVLASNSFDVTALTSGLSIDGFFRIATDIANAESNASVLAGAGKRLYTFIGNQSSLVGSNQIALIDAGSNVITDFAGAPPFTSDNPVNASSALIHGSIVNIPFAVPTPGIGTGTSNTTGQLRLDVVPEPSSVALLGLGGMVLVFRRRK